MKARLLKRWNGFCCSHDQKPLEIFKIC